jgi:hypothetical protein
MKLKKPSIDILIGVEFTEITIRDGSSNIEFVKVKLTTGQLSAALSRQIHVECDAEVRCLDKIGKTHENKYFEFEVPEGTKNSVNLVLLCNEALNNEGMSEWVSDQHYSSQNSFFKKDGKRYARVIVRRWV